MSHTRDSSPVYYREIQKNAYLKRVPDEGATSKGLALRPLGIKKPPVKPLWTQLCVHNGRTPYLEQYRDPASARAHRPVWRASLLTARHVTASVTAKDSEYDFLVDTHDGPVRMLAPDWESMQDWVSCLRSRLHELKVLPLCENVYCAPPAAPAPRAAARDPMSPLPPAPLPPDRIPGIDLTPLIRNAANQQTQPAPESESLPPASTSNTLPATDTSSISNATSQATETTTKTTANVSTGNQTTVSNSSGLPSSSGTVSTNVMALPNVTSPYTLNTSTITSEAVDISSWDTPETSEQFQSLPSTSQVPNSVTKICGQNICLDDSIFKRTFESDDDDFLSDLSSVGSKTGSLNSKTGSLNNKIGSTDGSECCEVNNYRQTVVVTNKGNDSAENGTSDRPTNITVIQVSNKEPPHTAIPVIGPETDVFDFNFKTPRNPNFVNIVNTEVNVQNSNEYGTVFSKNEPEYGHLSLTTTVSLTGDVKPNVSVRNDSEGLYEKLCLASTSSDVKASPLSVRRLRNQDKGRKSSLPNLDAINSDSTYEYLFLGQNNNVSNSPNTSQGNVTSNNVMSTTSNLTSTNNLPCTSSLTSTNNLTCTSNVTSTGNVTLSNNVTSTSNVSSTSVTSTRNVPSRNVNCQKVTQQRNVRSDTTATAANITITTPESNRMHINSVSIVDSNPRTIRSNVERSNSNTYDVSPRREARTEQSNGVKRNGRVEKIESIQPKPIWKRGLTELSLLTRLRGMTQGKRHDSPDRQHDRNAVTSPVKVVRRSRPEARVDSRRRSSSLSNGQSPPSTSNPPLQTLRARQAAMLRNEQIRGAALVASIRNIDPPIFVDYNKQVWVAWWGVSGGRVSGRAGDRLCGVRGVVPRDAGHARTLLTNAVDILFHRVPLAKIYVITKRDQESIGIKLDSEGNITSVECASPAAAAGVPPPGKWAVTEVNNRPLNLLKINEDDITRLSLRGTEASVLIQPSAFVKKLRAALKGNKTLLGLR